MSRGRPRGLVTKRGSRWTVILSDTATATMHHVLGRIKASIDHQRESIMCKPRGSGFVKRVKLS